MPNVQIALVGIGKQEGAAYLENEYGNIEAQTSLFSWSDDYDYDFFNYMLSDAWSKRH